MYMLIILYILSIMDRLQIHATFDVHTILKKKSITHRIKTIFLNQIPEKVQSPNCQVELPYSAPNQRTFFSKQDITFFT